MGSNAPQFGGGCLDAEQLEGSDSPTAGNGTSGEDRLRLTAEGINRLRVLVEDEGRLSVDERVLLLLAVKELRSSRRAAAACR